MKKPLLLIFMSLALLMMLGQSVWAFSDIKGDPNADKISALKEQGILNGQANGKFNPGGKLTYAAGIALLVKGLDLNIDHIRFIKEPKASDYFTNLKDDAWYSSFFIIAHLNGLEVPKDVKADQPMTREQFAHHLFRAMITKGDYAFIEIYISIKDEAAVNPAYMDSVQKLLITKIAGLDKNQMFYPKSVITRGQAAAWLHGAIEFVRNQAQTPPGEPAPQPSPLSDLKITTTAVSDKVQEVTISAMAPHPGYGIKITSIVFEGTNAVIHTEPIWPDPDKMYPQVITEVKAVTYLDVKYKAVLAESGVSSKNGSTSVETEAVTH